ncbi:tRNA-modifying protein YgfZ [Buchnera aphidicola]|uniref:tRNA-modifying protein YgfZ n=1 Tax=Buchnera aphidicola TaxID=9 RepID=UPI003464D50C
MENINFEKLVYPSKKLALSLIELDDWSLIRVSGTDSRTYLQSQLTINVDLLQSNKHIICAHCNINGKVWSILRLFFFNNDYAYIERKDVVNIQIRALKKYSIFSRVFIHEENNFLLFGVAGSGYKAREMLSRLFINLPDKNNTLVTDKNITLLWIGVPEERFLLIIPKDHKIINNIKKSNIIVAKSNQWLSLDIESGFPIINKKMMNKFVPLFLNLEKVDGIDFKKGCYCGQEVIAKIKFRSINKYSLYWLVSVTHSQNLPEIGSLLELKKFKQWYVVGYVLVSVIMYDGSIWMQAVLHSGLIKKSEFRVCGEKNNFFYAKTDFL